MAESWMVMIAGPYRSGAEGNPHKREENLRALESAALGVWERGHLPVIGEWLALPLARTAGSREVGDAVWESIGYPVADELIDRCDAVLRLPGASRGADGDVARAQARGLAVFRSLDELPLGNLTREARP